jgi:DNA-binding transcriptional ArsR family regulator
VAADWELNLFTSDPTLLERGAEDEYARAARTVAALSSPDRLKLLHALAVGEATAQRAALWTGLPQPVAERELAAMTKDGVVYRRDLPDGPRYAPFDGHVVVQLHVALAHGREALPHPRLLAARRRARGPADVRHVG